MIFSFFLVAVGIFLLYVGADRLVEGAKGIAAKLGVAPLVVGLTVVALGTSVPELVTSLIAYIKEGRPELTIGNIIGSNTANIGLVTGLAALLSPITVSSEVRKREMVVVLVGTLLCWWAMISGEVTRWQGLLGLFLLLLYLGWQVYLARKREIGDHRQQILLAVSEGASTLWQDVFFFFLGLVALIFGAESLVQGALRLASKFGLSEHMIGATIVAVGTSLPEAAVTVLAASRGHFDLSLGNVLGSNFINLFLVMALCAFIAPFPVTSSFAWWDGGVMVGMTSLLAAVVWTRPKIGRVVGGLFFVLYICYIGSIA